MKTKKALKTIEIVRNIYPKVERVLPRIAHSWAIKKFSMPLRYSYKNWEIEILNKAEIKYIPFKKDRIAVYEWGVSNSGAWILLVHGWAGRATQFDSIIRALVEEGYRVLSFDGRAHGKSSGRRTNLIDFRDVIEILSIKYGGFASIVGHSFGGVASAFAMTGGAESDQLITINSPTVAKDIVQAFVSSINGSQQLHSQFYKYIKIQFGRDFNDLELLKLIPKLLKKNKEVRIIADENDEEVPINQTEQLLNVIGHEYGLITQGFGHNKILASDTVVKEIIQKIKRIK